MRKLIKIFLFVSIMQSGCVADFEQPTIENYGMVGIMGFDIGEEEGKMKVTVTLPQPEKDVDRNVQKFTVDAETPHRALMEASTRSEKQLSTAQLRVILFSEEFAREVGVWEVLEDMYRDPRVGTNSYIAVVKGKVEDLLKKDYEDKPNINRYLNKLLTPMTITAFSPFTTNHHFIRHVTSRVTDPMAPYLEEVNDSIQLTKIAIFKGDKMVSTIEREEAKMVESIKRNRKTSDIAYRLPGDGSKKGSSIVLNFIRSKRDIKTNGNPENPELYIYLYISGALVNYTGDYDLSIQKEKEELEDKLSKQIEKSISRTMKQFQELGVDPIGAGDFFRAKFNGKWSKEEWNEIFSRAKITVHVEPRIMSTGTIH